MYIIFGTAKVLFSMFQETFNSIAVSRNLASALELFPLIFQDSNEHKKMNDENTKRQKYINETKRKQQEQQ